MKNAVLGPRDRPRASSTHESYAREDKVLGSTNRGFGLVFAAVFTLIGLWPLLDGRLPRWWSVAIALVFAAASIIAPGLLAPANRLWTRFGLILHRVTNPLIMGIVFFGFVTPIGLTVRLLGKDILRRRLDRDAESYWLARRPPGPAPDTMTNQF